jgi:hypothetical protein
MILSLRENIGYGVALTLRENIGYGVPYGVSLNVKRSQYGHHYKWLISNMDQ